MIDSALKARNASLKVKLTVKSAVSIGLIALAVVLPLIFHAAFGAAGGQKWLPIYLPIMIGGCLLGVGWGAGVGALAPIASFAVTSAFGIAMPTATRLPYMVAELAVFGAVGGLFSRVVYGKPWTAVFAVLVSAVAGRAAFMTVAAVFQTVSPITAQAAWSQIQAGLVGLAVQSAVAIAAVIITAVALKKSGKA